jgi:prepilin-type N-terminal cleavage/methylation domain-containing protein
MKNKKLRKFERGLTLPEIMVSVFVFSLMILLTSTVLRGGQEQVTLTEARINLEESLRQSIERIGLEVREASPSLTGIGANGESITFQIPTAVSDAGDITWSNQITYQVVGTQLVRLDVGTDQSTVIANDVQSIVFEAAADPISTVVYTVNVQKTLTNGRVLTAASAGETRLRNV